MSQGMGPTLTVSGLSRNRGALLLGSSDTVPGESVGPHYCCPNVTDPVLRAGH